jgi:hypothetical protein
VCHAYALNRSRVAKDGWRDGEANEESYSGAKQNRRDVDADLIEESGIQQLLDGVGAVDPNILLGRGGLGADRRSSISRPMPRRTSSAAVCTGISVRSDPTQSSGSSPALT